ncbi:MAG: hypothetical protein ACFB4J_02605 [Elainellaceae cyanobacterium]
MAAPNDFENLQSVYMRVYNRMVRESFREDIPDDAFSTPEAQMRYACLIKDNDTATMMQLRSNLFLMIREEAARLQAPIYGIPTAEYQEAVRFRPQVQLHFEEPRDEAAAANRERKRVRASFRLMNKTPETVTQTDMTALRNRIAQQFPRSYRFRTGRYKLSYRHREEGLELVIPPYTEPEGRQFISKVLLVAGATPEWDRLTVSTYPDRNFNRREYARILGRRRRLPQQRPVANVYLKKAELKLHGMLTDAQLYETW